MQPKIVVSLAWKTQSRQQPKLWSVWHEKRNQGSNQIAESIGRPDEQKPHSEIARKGINADLNCQGCIENAELKF
jgi:hypothetical protein